MAKKSAVNRPLLGIPAKPKRDLITIEPEILTKIIRAIRTTWTMIAYDCQGSIDTNSEALEVTIDANHVAMYGGPEGRELDKLITDLCAKHGYKQVHQFLLSKVGQLV